MLSYSQQQERLNVWTATHAPWLNPVVVDGRPGKLTRRRTSEVKWLMGLPGHRSDVWTPPFVWILAHPGRTRRHVIGVAGLVRGKVRRATERARVARQQALAWGLPGVTTFDGRPVAKAAVPYLRYAREHGWHGGLNSGWRDPVYSRSLCIRMCGAPQCPGRCAGLASNHVGSTKWRFAVDVSDYYMFGRVMASMSLPAGVPRLHNYLGAADPVHYSPSGR